MNSDSGVLALDLVAIIDPVCGHRLYSSLGITCYIVDGTYMVVDAVADVKSELPSSLWPLHALSLLYCRA